MLADDLVWRIVDLAWDVVEARGVSIAWYNAVHGRAGSTRPGGDLMRSDGTAWQWSHGVVRGWPSPDGWCTVETPAGTTAEKMGRATLCVARSLRAVWPGVCVVVDSAAELAVVGGCRVDRLRVDGRATNSPFPPAKIFRALQRCRPLTELQLHRVDVDAELLGTVLVRLQPTILHLTQCRLGGNPDAADFMEFVCLCDLMASMPLVEVDLSYNPASAGLHRMVASAGNAEILMLDGCNIGQDLPISVAVLVAVAGYPRLRTLSLQQNRLGLVASALSHCLAAQAETLDTLCLGLNGIGNNEDEDDVELLCLGLGRLQRLELLTLSSNPLAACPGNGAVLCRTLARLSSLVHLVLHRCQFGRSPSTCPQLAEALAGMPRLQRLDLSCNQLGGTPGDLAVLMSAAAELPRLQEVDLSYNLVGRHDTAHQVLALVLSTTATSVKLNRNRIGGDRAIGAAQLARLQRATRARTSQTQARTSQARTSPLQLDLSGNRIGGGAGDVQALLALLPRRLELLDLSYNLIGPTECGWLARRWPVGILLD
jgi:Ran GTPase-activating protein (RanGAP) involved in mRNA processing and transport